VTYPNADTADLNTVGVAGLLRQSHNSAALQKPRSLQKFANAALKSAAGFWFIVAAIGQLVFALYIVVFYGRTAMHGNWKALNKAMPHAYVPGDTLGNVVSAIHLLLAVVIIVGGLIQLIPQTRERAPSFHRWNGRVYILTAFAISIVGPYALWSRGTVGDLSQHIASSLNAVLIVLCAVMALRYAIARKFSIHRRWALRLFLVVSGVWFFRVGLMLWIALNKGPVGFNMKTFTGPVLTIWAFGKYLLPLAVLELYLRARDRAGAPARIAMAVALVVLTLGMGVGIAVFSIVWWLPHMK